MRRLCYLLTSAVVVAVVLMPAMASGITITPVWGTDVTQAQKDIINAKIALWEPRIAEDKTVTVTFQNGDLGDGSEKRVHAPGVEYILSTRNGATLAETTDFGYDADGDPSSATITINNNDAVDWHEGDEPIPADKTDLWTVINHELAHALGFTVACDHFADRVTDRLDGLRDYTSDDGTVKKRLTDADDGTHLDPTQHPDRLMNPVIPEGTRRTPTQDEIDMVKEAWTVKPVANARIELDEVQGLWQDAAGDIGPAGTWYIDPSEIVVFRIRYANETGDYVAGMTNGFEISCTDMFTAPVGVQPIDMSTYFDLVNIIGLVSADGSGADTVTASYSVMLLSGIPDGFSEITLEIATGCSVEGARMCLDSTYYPPSGTWLWAPGGVPSWNGPRCWDVAEMPNQPAVVDNCPDVAYTGSHCDSVTYDFDYTDPDAQPGPWSFVIVSGVGTIVPGTGVWSYTPSLADVGASLAVEVAVDDGAVIGPSCTWDLNFTNVGPTITDGCGTYQVGMGNTINIPLTTVDGDCDPGSMYVVSVTPTPVGGYSVAGNTLTFNPAENPGGDGGVTFDFLIEVTDGNLSDTCLVTVEVLEIEPYEIQIEKTHNTIQGGHELVDVILETGDLEMGGFDFLIGYDASALSFMSATPGQLLEDCGWEYFTYRYGVEGNCGDACPSGLMRIIALAETNNGPNHPSCFLPDSLPATLFSIDMLVTDDRTFECQYVPIRFFWGDCGDNAVSSVDGEILYVSDHVYDFEGTEITDPTFGFPTYFGVQIPCLDNPDPDKPALEQFIDFTNGGVDIICADSIDDRGDINLNGTAHEIADAVLFSNYFVYGLGVFNVNLEGQVAASDVNADGLTLSVADLVYLIRVIVGDARPYSKLSPVAAGYAVHEGVLSVDRPMGAAHVTVAGNVTPTLLADNMDMQYSFDGKVTSILIWSMEPDQRFAGDFVSMNGEIRSVELATYDGAPVVGKLLPTTYHLAQNYPNPFNPSTQISFRVPGDYRLTIFNIRGQVVAEFSGTSQAAQQELVEWQADGYASGVYYYRLEADDFSQTRKMLLLK